MVVFMVPLDDGLEALGHLDLGFPAEAAELGGIDAVGKIVVVPILDELHVVLVVLGMMGIH